jgi:hypothetical protein
LGFGVSEKGAQGVRGGGQRNATPTLGGLQGQKGVEVLKRHFVERTVASGEPSQQLLGVPASLADGALR